MNPTLSAWLAAVAFLAAGICIGLVIALAMIPEQPDRILVPVPQPPVPAPLEGITT